MKTIQNLAIASFALLAGASLSAQVPLLGSARVLNPTSKVKSAQFSTSGNAIVPITTAKLPIWQYEVVSARDAQTYRGSIVGGNPYKRGARTTTIPVVIIPIRVVVTNVVTSAGTLPDFAFDPTSPDDGILGAGRTAVSLLQQSDQFLPTSHTINGVDMGVGNFTDAFQRASFWPVVQSLSSAYHLAFSVTVAPKQTLAVQYNSTDGSVFNTVGQGVTPSTNPLGTDNPATYLGAVQFSTLDAFVKAKITSLGIQPNQFPLFLLYGAGIALGPANNPFNCCALGYHQGQPTAADPGQTYGVAMYGQDYIYSRNTMTVSHELVEWVNDPSLSNTTPAWGNIGQVDGCQINLETGDPLTGFEMSGVVMPNGVTYYSQEQAFFSWFFGAPFKGAGNSYSSAGSLAGFARDCPPGGSN